MLKKALGNGHTWSSFLEQSRLPLLDGALLTQRQQRDDDDGGMETNGHHVYRRRFTTNSLVRHAAEPEPVPLSKLKDSFLDGTSSSYLEELEERYRDDPTSVDKTWASFFKSMGAYIDAGVHGV